MQKNYKNTYEEAKMEVIMFSETDSFITTSGEGGEGGKDQDERGAE